jgi:uncharacterized protein YbjQ (UPF0145 family)
VTSGDGDPRAQRSADALAAGGLPVVAGERMARMRASGAWTSDLSVAEYAAIRSVGFEPVGQVLGTSVYQIGFSGYGWCGAPAMVGVSPLYRGMAGAPAGVGGYDEYVAALTHARHLAMDRMRAEARTLEGDGVVAVELTLAGFPGAVQAVEFRAIGTAVRASGRHHVDRPFLSDLSGQDFAKLVYAGWIPVDVAVGIAVDIRHDDWSTQAAASVFNRQNIEIPGYTQLVNRTRSHARATLARDAARVGGQAVVVRSTGLRLSEQECRAYQGGRDHVAEATWIGTSIAQFRQSASPATAVRSILRTTRRAGGRTFTEEFRPLQREAP